jgi:DNA polymerase I-like protein with 3'-5' exonuclease and polymerase domains
MIFFLIPTLNISDEGANPIFVGCYEDSEPQIISLNDIDIKTKELVVFNAPILIDYLRVNKIGLPKNIIDVFQIFKLINGKPTKYHKYSEQQVLWHVFNKYIEDKEELKDVIETLNFTSKTIIETNLECKLFLFLMYLKKVYSIMQIELSEKGEIERFKTIEKPFNFILANRQYEGIFLSHLTLNEKIEIVSNQLSSINKRIRYEYNIFNPQNTAEVKSALQINNFVYLSKITKAIDKKSFWNFVKTGSEQNEFLKLLYDAYRISFDKNSLIKIIVEEDGKVYPIFDCCGTVTSRTQVRMPLIQQLKKSSRDIFSAKENYTLLYADYSQFEPGILANLAEDEKLIECYNQEDLYSSLSIELFGNKDLRPFCKIIFLSFMYGMSETGLENLVKDFFQKDGVSKKEELQNFFGKFTSLIPYKIKLQEIALKEKRICSSFGNHRYFETNLYNHLPSKVKRWVLSQKIQGTASLILKTAIINCCKDDKIEFLIPMHDAALFQVPIEFLEEKKEIIKKEFESAMLLYCPKLKPKVVFKKFTE